MLSRRSSSKSKAPESGRNTGSGDDFAESIQSAVGGAIRSALAPMLQSLRSQAQPTPQRSNRVSSRSLDSDHGSDDDFQARPAAKKR